MLISHNWLKKYLPQLDTIDMNRIANALTNNLAEVENIRPAGQALQRIVCGEVVAVNKMPESKKLTHCQVRVNESEIKSIVCGAPNVAVGQKVAVCLTGGTVYDAHNEGKTMTVISKALAGVVSDGMICSEKELGLTGEHEGIMVLESELPIGSDLTPILKDYIYEIENKSLSHRPDCFSHEGIAREIGAFFELEFIDKYEEIPLIATKKLPFEVVSKVPVETCPRFASIVISDLKTAPSPLWLKTALIFCGIRPINNIVDTANYIMLDKGQPLHTYDYDKIDSRKLVIRFAKDNEKMTALDGKGYTLNPEVLVIANGSQVDDIAGIMGGQSSEISNNTKNIILEAANFNMYAIRKASRALGIRTEASTRFEKGQDPNQAIKGLTAAAHLIMDLCQGELASDLQDWYPEPRTTTEIPLDLTQVKRFLGIELTVKEIISYLQRLHFEVKDMEKIANLNSIPDSNQPLLVIVPTFRSDIKIEQDLLEEIVRIYGFQKLQPTLPQRLITATNPNTGMKFQRKIVATLTAAGMDELLTYSFVGKKLYESLKLEIGHCVRISNPLSPELEYFRDSLLPNLIDKISLNTKKYEQFKYFELGRVVFKELNEDKLHLQPMHLAGISYDTQTSEQFSILKGVVEKLCSELALDIDFEATNDLAGFANLKPLLHPGRFAAITLQSKVIGIIAELHPAIVQEMGIKGRVGIFELDASILSSQATYFKGFKQISVYQSLTRDLSFWIDTKVSYAAIRSELNALQNELIIGFALKDVFQKSSSDNRKSITLSFSLQSQTKTLTDADVQAVMDTISAKLANKFQAEFRK